MVVPSLIIALAGASTVGSDRVPPPSAPPNSATVGVRQEVAGQRQDLEARLWLDRAESSVVQRGDRLRIYYSTSRDAFVALFHIDTDGRVRLVFPRAPDENHYVRGGRDYQLYLGRSAHWTVEEDPGIGYFFLVASSRPFDFSGFRHSGAGQGRGSSHEGETVHHDPYLAMDDYVARLVPGWEDADYALDFTEYHVGGSHAHPRFLCYDCHRFRPYSAWNPYHQSCLSFRVVIYEDDFYYPLSWYRGGRVVYQRLPPRRRPRFGFKERADGESGESAIRRRSEGRESEGRGGRPARRAIARDRSPSDPGTGRGGRSGAVKRRAGRGGERATEAGEGDKEKSRPALRRRGSGVDRARPSSSRKTGKPVVGAGRPSDRIRKVVGRAPPVTSKGRRVKAATRSSVGKGSVKARGSNSSKGKRPVLRPRTKVKKSPPKKTTSKRSGKVKKKKR